MEQVEKELVKCKQAFCSAVSESRLGAGSTAASKPDTRHHPGVIDSGNHWWISVARRRDRLSSSHVPWLAPGTRRQLPRREQSHRDLWGTASLRRWPVQLCTTWSPERLMPCGRGHCLWQHKLKGKHLSIPESEISTAISIWKRNFSTVLDFFLKKNKVCLYLYATLGTCYKHFSGLCFARQC